VHPFGPAQTMAKGGMPGKVTYFSAELTRSAGGKYPLPA